MDFSKSQNYVAAHRDETIEILRRFLQADTLLFWSEEPNLFAYQKEYWQPILDVLNGVFKLELQTTTGIIPPENRQATLEFEQYLCNMSDKELTGCFLAAQDMKSVLLGLLLAKQKLSITEAFNAAFLEELYQNQFWGEDTAAINAREKIKKQLEEIAEFIKS